MRPQGPGRPREGAPTDHQHKLGRGSGTYQRPRPQLVRMPGPATGGWLGRPYQRCGRAPDTAPRSRRPQHGPAGRPQAPKGSGRPILANPTGPGLAGARGGRHARRHGTGPQTRWPGMTPAGGCPGGPQSSKGRDPPGP
eukprot:15452605-Alexandrium_andersonii.AAC.1